MNRYLVSPQAVADIEAVWDYLGIEQNSPLAASRQLRRFYEKFALLASQPLLGELRNDLRPGLRIFPADSYVIIYYAMDDGIEIVGLVHAARHVEWLFESGQR